jgi:sugar lactone lactonase YvrE
VSSSGAVYVADRNHGYIFKYVPSGGELEESDYTSRIADEGRDLASMAVDSANNLYVTHVHEGFSKFDPAGKLIGAVGQQGSGLSRSVSLDPSTGNVLFNWAREVVITNSADVEQEIVHLGDFQIDVDTFGMDVNEAQKLLYLSDTKTIHIFKYGPGEFAGASTADATNVQRTAATLQGVLNPKGFSDATCEFEYGLLHSYGGVAPCTPAGPFGDSADHAVTADISGLTPGETYYYRLKATNSEGTSYGEEKSFTALPVAPAAEGKAPTDVHSDTAVLHGTVYPGGGITSYYLEWGLADCNTNPCTRMPGPDRVLADKFKAADVSQFVSGLQPGSVYHFRIVATNASETTGSPDRTFTTFPRIALLDDPCPNALVRQQTSASLLLDCRAYELVSAASTGGYNVEADLVPGQRPFAGYPDAGDPPRALYGVHDGGIPGTGNPTNHGTDSYVATRGADGWRTSYVGVPANGAPGSAPFASPLLAASPDLSTFAFGGEKICDPCFADGSTNIPLRRRDGSLVQGMAGSQNPGPANPAGTVRKRFSRDGSHFVFGSTARFEADGNSNGDVTIYDRNLNSGSTQVISKLPDGSTMTGPGIAELDMSADGSRTVVAKRVSVDAAGNTYWHPYMHVGNSPNTIDLAPGTSSGVLYNGMTEDGTAVFFATPDALEDDGDTSVDLYRAQVTGSGVDLTRISTGTGTTGDTDDCEPVATSANPSWNSVGDAGDCSVAAIAGGGGIAEGDGSVYFLSPELLDGSANGTANAPNLFLARPGQDPAFVSTLESELTGSLAPPVHPFLREQSIIANPKSIAVDADNGDLYVLDGATSTVQKFDSSGAAAAFSSSQPYVSANRLTGSPRGDFRFAGHYTGLSQIAVDSSGGPTDGYIYVTDRNSGTPEEDAVIDVFDETGTYRGALPSVGYQGFCGVAVDPSGSVYGATFGAGSINKYVPVDGNPANNVSGGSFELFSNCQLAADSSGALYTVQTFSQRVLKFDASSFSGVPSSTLLAAGSDIRGVAVDPADDDVYVVAGDHFMQFDATGKQLGDSERGAFSGSIGIAADIDGEIYVANPSGGSIAVFGPPRAGSSATADNPTVVHAVNDAETHRYADFQVTPDGGRAAFVSTLPLTGHETAGFTAIYRYDATSGGIACASCAPTGEGASGDSTLASNGLSLSDDGRVFFNSIDALTARDLNKRKDVYEFANGKTELISTGTSPYDSSLLGISADATDAFFFTRERLVDQDLNESLVRIYDARSGGGFLTLPPSVPCQASDECHGPGTKQAPPPPIGTFKGSLGNEKPPKTRRCKKGFVMKRGKCVKKPKNGKNKRGSKNKKRSANKSRSHG